MQDIKARDFSVSDLCALFSCAPPTVYKLINDGKLKSYKVGRARRITHESVAKVRQERKK